MFEGIKTALFVGAHADDEIVCAGTLRKLVKAGVDVNILTFGPSRTEKGTDCPKSERDASLAAIGASSFAYLNYHSDHLSDLASEIRDYLYNYARWPDIAFILSPNDDHPSHACVARECERTMKNAVPRIVRCQFPWNYQSLQPNLFVELTPDELQTKRDCIKAYGSQLWRYDYEQMLAAYCLADGLAVKQGPTEKFEILRWAVCEK